MEKYLYLVTYEAKNHSALSWLEPIKCTRLVEAPNRWFVKECIEKHDPDFVKILSIEVMGDRNDILVA